MKSLLLIAHGSRNQDSNSEIRELAESLKSTDNGYDEVEFAFLELADPDIMSAMGSLIARGAEEITVLPYFLARGNHVASDIPEIVSRIQSQHENVKIDLVPHIGSAKTMLGLILEHLNT